MWTWIMFYIALATIFKRYEHDIMILNITITITYFLYSYFLNFSHIIIMYKDVRLLQNFQFQST